MTVDDVCWVLQVQMEECNFGRICAGFVWQVGMTQHFCNGLAVRAEAHSSGWKAQAMG